MLSRAAFYHCFQLNTQVSYRRPAHASRRVEEDGAENGRTESEKCAIEVAQDGFIRMIFAAIIGGADFPSTQRGRLFRLTHGLTGSTTPSGSFCADYISSLSATTTTVHTFAVELSGNLPTSSAIIGISAVSGIHHDTSRRFFRTGYPQGRHPQSIPYPRAPIPKHHITIAIRALPRLAH